jgi:hypothetical protein
MCGECGRTFEIEAGLAWSLPVNVCRLGAHLDAHVTVKPVVEQFLLCYKFGQGDGVHLKALPREIIDLIINHYTAPIREQKFDEWDWDFACYEGRCNVRDHFNKSAWYSFLSDAWEAYADEITEENEHEYAASIAEDQGEELDVHSDRSSDWESRLSRRKCPSVHTGTAAAVFNQTVDGNFSPLEDVWNMFNKELL